MPLSKIAILLSTFNGERWLPDLLQSLENQSVPFELIWRDDGSSDGSMGLVRNLAWPQITEVRHSEVGENMGACASFGVLMRAALESDAELFFFADQDDIWQPDKLSRAEEVFHAANCNVPQLVHHDLRVVKTSGVIIADSLWRYMALTPEATELRHYLTRNSVTGCGAACNRELLDAACPVPDAANMHDWWLALVASATGKIVAMPDRLVDYRQHGANTLGAKSLFSGLNPFTNWRQGWRRGNAEYQSLFPQAKALSFALEHRLSETTAAELSSFIRLTELPLLRRLLMAHRLGLRDRNPFLWVVAMIRVALNGQG